VALETIKRSIRRILLDLPTRSKYKFIMRDWIRLSDLQACSKVLETKRFSRNIRPIELPGPANRDIIVLAPHPDDDILGSGGTLLTAIETGASVTVVYLTNGSNDKHRSEKIKEESKSVCNLAGFTPNFLDFSVGQIPLTSQRFEQLLEQIFCQTTSQFALFLPFFLDDHDDHRRINQIIQKSQVLNANLSRVEIWSYQVYSTVIPNVIVDITTKIERKAGLLRLWKHVSGNRDWAHYITGINAANCRFLSGSGEVYGEAFFVLPLSEYLSLAGQYFAAGNKATYYSNAYQTDPEE